MQTTASWTLRNARQRHGAMERLQGTSIVRLCPGGLGAEKRFSAWYFSPRSAPWYFDSAECNSVGARAVPSAAIPEQPIEAHCKGQSAYY
jgi:hypothetical protein